MSIPLDITVISDEATVYSCVCVCVRVRVYNIARMQSRSRAGALQAAAARRPAADQYLARVRPRPRVRTALSGYCCNTLTRATSPTATANKQIAVEK
ncbi:hypothetical protein EVAR_40465_1 [Eumeta japonica]|uniref:Uncharacterized protein n=1 Tax=Eumeta variegata TaxID=151549 RepID=A0A4C1X003_EUMVA|nr:hypothetical protein EVAR_40465_1 [Eumeta japonica]